MEKYAKNWIPLKIWTEYLKKNQSKQVHHPLIVTDRFFKTLEMSTLE